MTKRIVLFLAAIAVLVATLTITLLSGSQKTGVASRSATTSPPDHRTCPSSCPRVPAGVVVSHLAFVDRSRPLMDMGAVLAPYRALPAIVWRPRVRGQFPLVVFVHGFAVSPTAYARFCRTLASWGFVVVAPSFPLEDPTRGYVLTRTDLPNEAVDVAFVIRQAFRTSALVPHLLPDVAVVGHSDGADVALMVGYAAGLFDARVGAIVADAPDPMQRSVRTGGAPLLLMQGDADPVVPYSSSQAVFRQLVVPTAYLTLQGAGHLAPIQGGTRWTAAVDASVRIFLKDVLFGRRPRVLLADLRRLPFTSIRWRWGARS